MRWLRLGPLLSAILLFIKNHEVSAQYATVLECPQTTAIARPFVQSAGQFVLPANIQPIFPGYDSISTDFSAGCGYPGGGNYPAPYPGYPPIVIDNDDSFFRQLLYLLIFNMTTNKRDNYYNGPHSYGRCQSCNCGCCGCSSCKCSCNCNSCGKKNNDNSSSSPTYIPIPIAIPVYTAADGCRYIDGFCDDILIQGPSSNCITCSGKDAGEVINLIIKADC